MHRDGVAWRIGVIIADEALRRVFGTHQATMFEMNKLLAQCLTQDAEPSGEPGG